MPGMPVTVKVGPHVYTVRRTTTAQSPDLGNCSYDSLSIGVRQRLRKSKAQEVLLHEILHACTYPSFCAKDQATDEEFVEATAPTLLQVLRDNPELVEYLRS